MTTYRGFDVLDVEPNWDGKMEPTFRRKLDTLDNGMAPIDVRDYCARNFGGFSFPWWCGSRQEVDQFWSFVEARKGRLVPFWLPTRLQDLIMSKQANSGDQAVTIKWRSYKDKVFPDTARRDIAFILPTGIVIRRITSASQLDATETLALDQALPVDVPVGSLVSFLVLCRLDTDEPELLWQTDSFATCELPVVEIPLEVK